MLIFKNLKGDFDLSERGVDLNALNVRTNHLDGFFRNRNAFRQLTFAGFLGFHSVHDGLGNLDARHLVLEEGRVSETRQRPNPGDDRQSG